MQGADLHRGPRGRLHDDAADQSMQRLRPAKHCRERAGTAARNRRQNLRRIAAGRALVQPASNRMALTVRACKGCSCPPQLKRSTYHQQQYILTSRCGSCHCNVVLLQTSCACRAWEVYTKYGCIVGDTGKH